MRNYILFPFYAIIFLFIFIIINYAPGNKASVLFCKIIYIIIINYKTCKLLFQKSSLEIFLSII